MNQAAQDRRGERFDTSEIMRLLPHRYPFLLVDQVLECVAGSHIVGIKNVSRTDCCASMSPYLVIEALAQLSVILAFRTMALQVTGRERVFFAGIDSARFRHAVGIGDRLVLRSSVERIRRMIGWFSAEASVGEAVVLEVSMLAAIKHEPV
jgi:3-hydroxyacyl-[acyl-carrier-protein] dehydratase